MEVGIDKISFYTPKLYIDLVELAQARGEDPDKYTIGIGQLQQAVMPLNQDIISMAANAAFEILEKDDIKDIDLVIFATESSVDQSQSAALVLRELLGLKSNTRVIEVKQACYAGTIGLMQARDYIFRYPNKKVLVIASDIARYGLESKGEVTQGAGAVAMLVSDNPRLAIIKDDSVYKNEAVFDFFRPTGEEFPIVDGKLSQATYNQFFLDLWNQHKEQFNLDLKDYVGFAFHMPYAKQVDKALNQIITDNNSDPQKNIEASKVFGKRIGNLYTASVFLSLISLLVNGDAKGNDLIGVFSYGSGAEAEFYSLKLKDSFEQQIFRNVDQLLDNRQKVSIEQYQELFNAFSNLNDQTRIVQDEESAKVVLDSIKNNIRQYKVNK